MLFKEASTAVAENFTDVYFRMHDFVYTAGAEVPSRVGATKEILDFKTTLTSPLNRCVAGYKRNMNVFFLLAEAMWIFNGRRDLEFLEIFNAGMREFSDGGKYFHAPYGWRLRHWDMNSLQELDSESRAEVDGSLDQISQALHMLAANPGDRRIVCSVWNPKLDLGTVSKDHPCNDLLLFKIRNSKLYLTIQNRSNDLNLGLPTNVFQFSFMGEVMAALLPDVHYGNQTHNSQSLHLYMQHDLTTFLQSQFVNSDYTRFQHGQINYIDFYKWVKPLAVEFNFKDGETTMAKKLFWVDFYLHSIIIKLLQLAKGNGTATTGEDVTFENELKNFCYSFWYTYQLLKVYVHYKQHKNHEQAIAELTSLYTYHGTTMYDVSVMAMNFFMRRVHDKDRQHFYNLEQTVYNLFPSYRHLKLGFL